MAKNNQKVLRFLGEYQKQLRKAPREALRAIAQNLAEESLDRIKEGFRKEADPFGHKWASKKIPDGRKVLSGNTSRLKQYKIKSVGATGFSVGPIVNYAGYHQSGTKHMVARVMFPRNRLPRTWEKEFKGIIIEILEDAFSAPKS